ncbi:MAG TPA: cytochrome c3 family protein [Dehalococcoidia bacterium]|nr:cytochrome c3 family protein [Dehalococcoidia bacterium]
MRKTTLLIGILAGVAVSLLAVMGSGGGTASADNGPHMIETGATPDKCASCHRIHTAKSDFLFKSGGTVEAFCYSCHGNGGPGSDLAAQEGTFYGETLVGPPAQAPGAPYGGKTASTTVGLRAGGFDTARIDTTDPNNTLNAPPSNIGVLAVPETVNSWHEVDGTTAGTMWGNGAIGTVGAGPSYALECISCHDPHGNGNYRILRTTPQGSGGAGYAIPDTYPKAASDYTTTNYFNMYFGGVAPANCPTTPLTDCVAPGMSILYDTSKWCSQCHTRYYATGGANYAGNPGGIAPAEGSRVDSGDAIFTYRHTSAGYGYSEYPPGSTPAFKFSNRACITCHASHGSNASMPGAYSSSVPWPDGSTVNPVNDTQRASLLKMDNRGICRKCHNIQ